MGTPEYLRVAVVELAVRALFHLFNLSANKQYKLPTPLKITENICKRGCGWMNKLMLQQGSQQQMDNQSNIQVQSSSPVLVCHDCGSTFTLLPNHLVAHHPQLPLYAICIDHQESYCLRCLEHLLKKQMQEIQVLQQRYIYQKQYQSYSQNELVHPPTPHQSHSIPQNITAQIQKLTLEEEELNNSMGSLREQTSHLKQKIYNLQIDQQKFWQGINKIERRTNKVQEKSINTKFDKMEQKDHLDQLSQISLIHLFTNIVVEDNVAFVQGMAMGKRSEGVDINWEEVAVGLGHLLVSLNFLVMKYNYQYKIIENIKFNGMLSEIVLKQRRKKLYLYYPKQQQKQIGQMLQILLFQTSKLCQHILQAQSVQYSQQFRIPFLINPLQHKIAQLYIDPFKMDQRIRWNNWTKVMRYFLINFKHMLTVYAINDKFL